MEPPAELARAGPMGEGGLSTGKAPLSSKGWPLGAYDGLSAKNKKCPRGFLHSTSGISLGQGPPFEPQPWDPGQSPNEKPGLKAPVSQRHLAG